MESSECSKIQETLGQATKADLDLARWRKESDFVLMF